MNHRATRQAWSTAIGLLLLSLAPACLSPASNPDAAPAKTSSLYLTTYATSFVDALRERGSQAGAFEVDRRPDESGLFRLDVEVWEGDLVRNLALFLEPQNSGVVLRRAQLGADEVLPASTEFATKLSACHKFADRRGRAEVGDNDPAPVVTNALSLQFSDNSFRWVRLDDLRVRDERFELCDLHFRYDQVLVLSSVERRNLMWLGVGSETAFLRLARSIDWQNEFLTECVDEAGIEIAANGQTGYWVPLETLKVQAGSVFAVRARESSKVAALVFVQKLQGTSLQLLIVRAPVTIGETGPE